MGPVELVNSLRRLADLVFLVAGEPEEDVGLHLLEGIGPVHALGDPGGEAAASRCDGLVTFTDQLVCTAAGLARRWSLPYQSPEAALGLTDKYRQRQVLASVGIDVVRHVRLEEPEQWEAAVDHVGLPAVLKPTRGAGSRNTYLVREEGEGRELVRRLLDDGLEAQLLLEEFLIGRPMSPWGDYVAVESATYDGEPRHLGVTGKFPLAPPFRETGQFWPSPLGEEEEQQILELTTRVLRALDYQVGLTNVEFKITPAGPRLIEVNGRLGGFVSQLYTRAGAPDLVELAGRLAMGERVEIAPPARRGVVFQYNHKPPASAVRLEGVEGLGDARRVPGSVTHRLLMAPGSPIPPGVHTQDLDLLNGVATSHDHMLEIVRQVGEALTFTFAMPERRSGTHLLSLRGTELPGADLLRTLGERERQGAPMTVTTALPEGRPGSSTKVAVVMLFALDAFGTGAFASAQVLFFTRVLARSAGEVSLGLSVAGFVSMLVLVPFARFADRRAKRPLLQLLNLGLAAAMLGYLLPGSLAQFLVVTVLVLVGQRVLQPVRGAVVSLAFPTTRLQVRGTCHVAYNVGFAVGGLTAAAVVNLDRPGFYRGLLLLDVASFAVCAVVAAGLPRLSAPPAEDRLRGFAAFRDRRYLLACGLNAVGTLHDAALFVGLPLWLLERTDAPRVLIPLITVVNCVCVVLFQSRLNRGTDTTSGAALAQWRAALLLCAGCLLLVFTPGKFTGLDYALVAVGGLLLTGAELLQLSGAWGLSYGLAADERITEYQSVFALSMGVQETVGPVLVTALVLGIGGGGWVVLGGGVVLLTSMGIRLLLGAHLLGWWDHTAVVGTETAGASHVRERLSC